MAAGQIRAPMIIPLCDPQTFRNKSISSDTKIEIISETGNTDAFFTINGMKPDILKKFDSHTYKYTVPFNLPPGKRTVKAIAVTKGGNRESNVTTKVFNVEQGSEPIRETKAHDDAYTFLEDFKKSAEEPYQFMQPKPKTNTIERKTRNGELPIKRNDRQTSSLTQAWQKSHADEPFHSSYAVNNSNNYELNHSIKLHREVDFLKCSFCLAPRPLDNKIKFCNNCGKPLLPLPTSKLPPPENGQLGICIQCRSTVPMNVSNCLVCEASLDLQNLPQATMNMRKHVLCSECGTTNPPNVESCLTCESLLTEKGHPLMMRDQVKPPESKDNSVLKRCYNCSRQNNVCARFCDWCGFKQNIENNEYRLTFLTCNKCSAKNGLDACFCGQCGDKLIPPGRENHAFDHLFNKNIYSNTSPGVIQLPLKVDNSLSTEYIIKKSKQAEKETQTVGLYYPSSASLKANERDVMTKEQRNNGNDYSKGPISLVSPGRGFWRKQVDHIISHLKAHASNNAEFQALIGEPRMGKLINANIHEEEFEMNLVLTFSLKGYKDPYLREISDNFEKKYLSSMLKRTGSVDSFRSDSTIRSNININNTVNGRIKSGRKKVVSRPSSAKVNNDPTRDLLREISKSGEGRESRINELIELGADCITKSKKGTPYLNIAVRNKHIHAALLLAKHVMNINEVDTELGNTVLHELVLLGSIHAENIPTFIEQGADPNIKNNKGETALDLAHKVKNDSAVNCIISKLGVSDVKNIVKPKLIETEDL